MIVVSCTRACVHSLCSCHSSSEFRDRGGCRDKTDDTDLAPSPVLPAPCSQLLAPAVSLGLVFQIMFPNHVSESCFRIMFFCFPAPTTWNLNKNLCSSKKSYILYSDSLGGLSLSVPGFPPPDFSSRCPRARSGGFLIYRVFDNSNDYSTFLFYLWKCEHM